MMMKEVKRNFKDLEEGMSYQSYRVRRGRGISWHEHAEGNWSLQILESMSWIGAARG